MAKVEDCPGFETFGADVKAEPFKLWLAQVGRERIEETVCQLLGFLCGTQKILANG